MDLLNRFLNTLTDFSYYDYDTDDLYNPDDGLSYREFIQTIADGNASGMEFNNGTVTMKDDKDNVLIWHILDYSCTYNGTCFLLGFYQPYTDADFIKGLIA